MFTYDFVPCAQKEPLPLNASTNTISIDFLIIPPQNIESEIKKCEQLDKTLYCLKSSWEPSLSPDIVYYRIYFKDQVIALIPAEGPLHFKTCLRSKKEAIFYEISAVDNLGEESEKVPLISKPKY